MMVSGASAVLHIRLTGQEVAASEMLCGGNVDVLVEPFFGGDAGVECVFQKLVTLAAQGRCGTLDLSSAMPRGCRGYPASMSPGGPTCESLRW